MNFKALVIAFNSFLLSSSMVWHRSCTPDRFLLKITWLRKNIVTSSQVQKLQSDFERKFPKTAYLHILYKLVDTLLLSCTQNSLNPSLFQNILYKDGIDMTYTFPILRHISWNILILTLSAIPAPTGPISSGYSTLGRRPNSLPVGRQPHHRSSSDPDLPGSNPGSPDGEVAQLTGAAGKGTVNVDKLAGLLV